MVVPHDFDRDDARPLFDDDGPADLDDACGIGPARLEAATDPATPSALTRQSPSEPA